MDNGAWWATVHEIAEPDMTVRLTFTFRNFGAECYMRSKTIIFSTWQYREETVIYLQTLNMISTKISLPSFYLFYKKHNLKILLSLGGNKMRSWKLDHLTLSFSSLPSSKRLPLSIASILWDLQLGSKHSSLSTIFSVIVALVWKTALVCCPRHSASCHNTAFPGHTEKPCPACSVAPVLATLLTESLTGFRNINYIWVSTTGMAFYLFFW